MSLVVRERVSLGSWKGLSGVFLSCGSLSRCSLGGKHGGRVSGISLEMLTLTF